MGRKNENSMDARYEQMPSMMCAWNSAFEMLTKSKWLEGINLREGYLEKIKGVLLGIRSQRIIDAVD